MTAQLALEDRFEKGAHFFLIAASLKFHAAVREIADGTGNVEPLRDIPHRPSESYALDIAFVKNLNRCRHASED